MNAFFRLPLVLDAIIRYDVIIIKFEPLTVMLIYMEESDDALRLAGK